MATFITVLDFVIAALTLAGGIMLLVMNAFLAGKNGWDFDEFLIECVNALLGLGLAPVWINVVSSLLIVAFFVWMDMSLSLYAGLFFIIPALIIKVVIMRKAKIA